MSFVNIIADLAFVILDLQNQNAATEIHTEKSIGFGRAYAIMHPDSPKQDQFENACIGLKKTGWKRFNKPADDDDAEDGCGRTASDVNGSHL